MFQSGSSGGDSAVEGTVSTAGRDLGRDISELERRSADGGSSLLSPLDEFGRRESGAGRKVYGSPWAGILREAEVQAGSFVPEGNTGFDAGDRL